MVLTSKPRFICTKIMFVPTGLVMLYLRWTLYYHQHSQHSEIISKQNQCPIHANSTKISQTVSHFSIVLALCCLTQCLNGHLFSIQFGSVIGSFIGLTRFSIFFLKAKFHRSSRMSAFTLTQVEQLSLREAKGQSRLLALN